MSAEDQGNSATSVQLEGGEKPLENSGKTSKSAKVLDKRFCVYKHYSESDQLLYIGHSCSTLHRLAAHKSSSSWFDQVATIRLEWHKTKKAMLRAERQLIAKHQPPFNVSGKQHKLSLLERVQKREQERLANRRFVLSLINGAKNADSVTFPSPTYFPDERSHPLGERTTERAKQ